MTTTKKTEKQKNTTKKAEESLYEAVQKHPERLYVKIGALSRAGLLRQYNEEEQLYGREVLKKTTNQDEITELINKYKRGR